MNKLKRRLNDALECPVCLELLDSSNKMLPCQHTFCLECLQNLFLIKKELRCPECRLMVDIDNQADIDNLQSNLFVMRVLETMGIVLPKKCKMPEKITISPGSTSNKSGFHSQDVEVYKETRKIQIDIQNLVHACQCRDATCKQPSCQKMKRVVLHTKICKRKSNGDCPICKHLIAFCCNHAKYCQEKKCPVPFCQNIKYKIKQKRIQARLQQAEQLRRRLIAMNTRRSGSVMGTTAVSPQADVMPALPAPHQPGTQTPPANVVQP